MFGCYLIISMYMFTMCVVYFDLIKVHSIIIGVLLSTVRTQHHVQMATCSTIQCTLRTDIYLNEQQCYMLTWINYHMSIWQPTAGVNQGMPHAHQRQGTMLGPNKLNAYSVHLLFNRMTFDNAAATWNSKSTSMQGPCNTSLQTNIILTYIQAIFSTNKPTLSQSCSF